MNLKDTAGIPEKPRKEYAALSIFMGSNLKTNNRITCQCLIFNQYQWKTKGNNHTYKDSKLFLPYCVKMDVAPPFRGAFTCNIDLFQYTVLKMKCNETVDLPLLQHFELRCATKDWQRL